MFMSEQLQEKWAPILEHKDADPIQDSYKKAVTSVLLENQESFLRQERMLTEAAPTNSLGGTGYSGSSTAGGPVAGFDPVLISLIRRSMPKLMAYDICGVQPTVLPVLPTLAIGVVVRHSSTKQIPSILQRTAVTHSLLTIRLVATQVF